MADFEPIKIPFDIPVEQIKKDTERVMESFADVDKSVARAEAKFNTWVKSQLESNKVIGGNVQANKQYATVLAELERRMRSAQDPKIVQAYANAIAKLKSEVASLGSQGGKLAPMKAKFDSLGNSINMITRDLPSFAYGAQMGFLAISNNIPIFTDEIAKLTAKNKELVASGQKSVPVWKSVLKSLFSWQTAISASIVLLVVYGKEIGEWISNLFKGKKAIDEVAESQKALNEGLKSTEYKKATRTILELSTKIKLAKNGLYDKNRALKEYNDTLGRTVGKVNSLGEAEKWLVDNKDKYVQMMLYKTTASKMYEKSAEELVKIKELERQPDIESASFWDNIGASLAIQGGSAMGGNLRGYEDYHKQVSEAGRKRKEEEKKALKEKADSYAKIAKEFTQLEADLAEELGVLVTNEKNTKNTISSRERLLERIAALDSEYARKSFAKDQQELQALRDKFDKIREEVVKFNANPKNKIKIDGSQLDTIQKNAESDLVYRQETARIEKQLAAQKKQYEDYEDYKTKFGKQEADKRYKNEIDTTKNYTDYLQSEIDKLKGKTEMSGVEQERYGMLTKQLEDYNNEQQQLYDEQLADLRSYEQKRLVLIEQFNEQYTQLLEDNKTSEAAVLKEKHKEELAELDDAQIAKLNSYKALFDGIVNLSMKELRIVLANAKKMLKLVKVSSELYAKIQREIKEIEELLNTKQLDEISLITKKVGELGASFEKLGESLGNSGFAEVGGLLSGLASNIDNILVSFDKSADKTDRIAAGIAGIVTVIDTIASAAAQRRKAEEEYYYAVLNLQNEYNLSLNEQLRLQAELKENVFLKDYVGRVKSGLKSLADANNKYNEALKELLGKGQAKTGLRNKISWKNVGKATAGGAAAGAAIGSMILPGVGTIVGTAIGSVVGFIGGLFGGKKKVPKYQHILREYPELYSEKTGELDIELAKQLKSSKYVNKETEQILENLLKQNEQIKKAREQIKGVIKELAGRLSQNLKNNLVEAFRSGEDAAKALGKTVDEVLEGILSSLIFNQIFNKAFEDLEKEMVASQEVGGDGSWLDDFKRFFETSKGLTADFNNAMKQAQKEAERVGFSVFKKKTNTQNTNSLKGAIRGMTEKQADLLSGQFGGLRLTQLDTNKILRSSHTAYMARLGESIRINKQIELNTRKTAENTNGMREGFKAVEIAVKQRSNAMKANGI